MIRWRSAGLAGDVGFWGCTARPTGDFFFLKHFLYFLHSSWPRWWKVSKEEMSSKSRDRYRRNVIKILNLRLTNGVTFSLQAVAVSCYLTSYHVMHAGTVTAHGPYWVKRSSRNSKSFAAAVFAKCTRKAWTACSKCSFATLLGAMSRFSLCLTRRLDNIFDNFLCAPVNCQSVLLHMKDLACRYEISVFALSGLRWLRTASSIAICRGL